MGMGDAIPHCLIKAPSLPNLEWSFLFLDVLRMEAAGKSFNPHLRRRKHIIRILNIILERVRARGSRVFDFLDFFSFFEDAAATGPNAAKNVSNEMELYFIVEFRYDMYK